MIFFILAILSVCAVSNAKPHNPRVVGGLPASEGQFPYLAQIKPVNPEEEDFALTGSIISNQWILTSAIIQWFPKDLKIVVGTIYNDGHSGYSYAVSDRFIHPKFGNNPTIDYFIGVIKVKGTIEFGENVKAIALSSSTIIPPNLSMEFAAWGTTDLTNVSYSPTLQHITLKSITMTKCRQLLPYYPFDDSLHFCTEPLGGNGPCNGDMGAPLVYGNRQLGIDVVSISCDTSLSDNPNFFVNIGVVRDWIKEVTGV